jgi:Zn-dependent M28 family amino/carboxypeptidase
MLKFVRTLMLTVSVVKVGYTQVFMRATSGRCKRKSAGIDAARHIRMRSATGRIAMQLSTLQTSFQICLAAALMAGAALGSSANAENIGSNHGVLARGVSAGEGAFRHLQMLQEIASANGGNRAAGTSGYDRSAQYVADRLKEAGYLVRFEEFDFPFFEERTSPILEAGMPGGPPEPAPSSAFRTLTNSGSGSVTALIGAVNLRLGPEPPPASNSGCEAADFSDFERGAIALLRRGTCTFQTKVDNAVAAGATAVVIMNEGTEGRKDAFSGQLNKLNSVPVLGVSYEFGRSLEAAARHGTTVRIAVDAIAGMRTTRNVLAETGTNGHGPSLIVGAHLDSVPEGPGINDNGSGSAVVLEAALRLARQLAESGIAVRFAFWGAEERGLVGSRHHVASLSDEERRRIDLYVNLDMVGSTNFVRYVQGPAAVGDGLAMIVRRELLVDFREHGLPVEERDGTRTGTDDASFSQKGIPTIGLYTGAGGLKSEALASVFGGEAGRPYDACYHQACDTIDNINREVLDQNTRAVMRGLSAVANHAHVHGAPTHEALDPSKTRR